MSSCAIYLAGPMTGLTWRQALEWRQQVTLKLESQWKLINPVRAQVPIDQLDEIITAITQDQDEDLEIFNTATGMTAQDEFFIDQSDWLFCNFLNANRVSIGTVYEIGYAWKAGKHILSVIPPGGLHDHPFIRRRSHLFVPTVEEATKFFQNIAV